MTTPTFEKLPNAMLAVARFDPQVYDPTLYNRLNVQGGDRFDRAAPKRQADFLAGRLVARAALLQFTGTSADIPVGENRAPVWPRGFNGSITHTTETCGAIVADDDMICGVDHEAIASGSALEALLDRCLSSNERQWVKSQSHHPADVMATMVFGAKECIYKALAPTVKRFFGFECAETIGWSDDNRLTLRLTETLHSTLQAGTVFKIRCELHKDIARTLLLTPRPQ